MNNGLLYAGGLLVVILAALFAVPLFVDWNGYRGVFEEEASKILGRDVRVGGGVNLRLLPTPYVRFEKVRIADITGQTGEPLVRADSFTMWLSGPALLRGVLEAKHIEIAKPVLSLVLDGSGSGNWASLKIKAGELPFVPRNVALRAVDIRDGLITISNGQAQPVAKLEAVAGELSADGLTGPFRFKGTVKWGGQDREIKFATTEPESDGSFRIKANARSEKQGTSFTVDGLLSDIAKRPRLAGEFSAAIALPFARSQVAAAPGGAGDKDAKAAKEQSAADIRAKVAADALGAKFDDVVISLDSAAEPQVIAGTASSAWTATPRFETQLSSKWLDLDSLSGESGSPFERLKQLGLGFLHAAGGEGAAAARLDIEQVKLGGETAGGLRLNAERQNGVVTLKEFKAGLPGGSRLDLTGELKDDAAAPAGFNGSLLVHGSNVSRFLAWLAKSGWAVDVKAEGPFSAEGKLLVSGKQFEFTDARAEVSGQALSGEVRVTGESRQKTAIVVEGSRLDTGLLFPAKAREIEDEIRRALGLGAEQPAPVKHDGPAVKDAGDVSLRVLAGELKSGDRLLRNVDATMALEGGEFSVPRSGFTTESGLRVNFEARVKNVSADPKGSIAYEFDAQSPAAMKDAAQMTGLSGIFPAERIEALGGGRMAALLKLGERGKAADVTFSGEIKGARISGRAELEGGLTAWRTGESRVAANVKAADIEPILVTLGSDAGTRGSGKARPADISLSAAGVFASGAAGFAQIASDTLNGNFNGQIKLTGTGLSYDGHVALKARDLAEAVELAGVAVPAGISDIPVEGAIEIAKDAERYRLETAHLALGASVIRGTATFERKPTGPASVAAEVRADKVRLAALLSPLLERPGRAARVATAAAERATDETAVRGSPWPEAIFNIDAMKGLEGRVKIGFATLELEEGLAAHDGEMQIALAPGKVSLSSLSARAANGKLEATVDLAKATAGVASNAHVKIESADLAAVTPSAKGHASLELTMAARAQSPAGLVSSFSGKGTLALEQARHAGPAAAQLASLSDAVLSGKIANDQGVITDSIAAALANSKVETGTRTIALAVADGALKADPFIIETGEGKTTVTTTVDLTSLAMDSVWRIAAIAPLQQTPPGAGPDWKPAPKAPLPPVSFVYTGRLAELTRTNVKFDTGDLSHELGVRLVERNLEELERLRRKEEERIRLEQDRRKAIDAERAAAAAAAAAARAAPPPPAVPPAAGQKPAEQLPPVLPESSGVPAPGAALPQQPDAGGKPPAASQTYVPQAGAAEAAAAAGDAPARTVPIEITPDPKATAAEALRPPPVPRPAAVPHSRPRLPTQSDEMSRALSGRP